MADSPSNPPPQSSAGGSRLNFKRSLFLMAVAWTLVEDSNASLRLIKKGGR